MVFVLIDVRICPIFMEVRAVVVFDHLGAQLWQLADIVVAETLIPRFLTDIRLITARAE